MGFEHKQATAMNQTIACCIAVLIALTPISFGGATSSAIREAAEFISKKVGAGKLGKSIEEIAETITKEVAKHGDEALPFVRKFDHVGFEALEKAGEEAPRVIKLFTRCGDSTLHVISKPKSLAIFIKHGDSAADAIRA